MRARAPKGPRPGVKTTITIPVETYTKLAARAAFLRTGKGAYILGLIERDVRSMRIAQPAEGYDNDGRSDGAAPLKQRGAGPPAGQGIAPLPIAG
jgi:hypothetical protein